MKCHSHRSAKHLSRIPRVKGLCNAKLHQYLDKQTAWMALEDARWGNHKQSPERSNLNHYWFPLQTRKKPSHSISEVFCLFNRKQKSILLNGLDDSDASKGQQCAKYALDGKALITFGRIVLSWKCVRHLKQTAGNLRSTRISTRDFR